MSKGVLSIAVAVAAAVFAVRGLAVEPGDLQPRPDDVAGALSLRVNDEAAPAGSIVQIKIDVTEPKPISTGKGKLKIKGLTAVQGIALMNHDDDTFGVALVDGEELTFFIHSPSALFGTAADYPIVTVAGTVDSGARIGTTFPLTMEPGALHFVGPGGATYPLEIKNGQLTVANVVSIGDVSPGSSVVPAGGVVRISGSNFTPDTRLQLSETAVAATRYVSSSRIDVVLGQTTDMHGLRIRARNDKPERSEATYFSYQRTGPAGTSNDAVLSHAVPLFAPMTYTDATVRLPRASGPTKRRAAGPSRGGQQGRVVAAFALQNLNASSVSASVELLDFFGHAYAVNTISIAPNQYLVREIGESFGAVSPPYAFRVRSAAPLHVLGILADHSGNSVSAVPPG